EAGVDSGLMIAQYAAAGIVSELKRLAVPASVDSIPSSAMQEDHVSMGWAAARKLRRAIDGFARVLAVELVTGARALDLRAPLQAGPGTGAVRDLLRSAGVAGPGADRYLSPDIETAAELVLSGAVRAAALGPAKEHGPAEERSGRTRPTPADLLRSAEDRHRARRHHDRHDDPHGPRAARARAHREELGRRGREAHAHEQPRPRGRRAPRRPRRLRRHRPGCPQLGGLRRDRAHARRA